MNWTAKTTFPFYLSPALAVATAQQVYDTPDYLQDTLADLSQLKYLPAEWGCEVRTSAASTAVVTVELMAGTTVIDSVDIDCSGGTAVGNRKSVDLMAVGGAQRLHQRVTVKTADVASGATATVCGWLSVSQPLTVGGCG